MHISLLSDPPWRAFDVALGLLDGSRMDAALLDVNIGLPSTPVARRLQDLGIPIVHDQRALKRRA
ncbi:hypothetical protein [Devosia insulae]|uniref:hypothetical protein n=1 Tax=Devosia insulae TaxID=408174 RepID=UPI00114CAB76|nr:hypothetical protein [Devosia insulae]